MEIRPGTASLALAEEFAIARGARSTSEVVRVELEHDGLVGRGEAAPVYYRGETVESALAFLEGEAPRLVHGLEPFALEAIGQAMWNQGKEAAARAALDAAAHDWIGRRLGVPLWRLLGLTREVPPTSYTLGIDSLEGTRDRARRARGYAVLKVKVGGSEDLERLHAIRAETLVPLRVDANEGWTLEEARELVPVLLELGVELIEQPFPARAYRDLEWLQERSPLPVVADESAVTDEDLAALVGIVAGVNVKLAKCGGIGPAKAMLEHAHDLGFQTFLGCMEETQVGIAGSAAVASLADWVDLDGCLLLADDPFEGLELDADHRWILPSRPGLGLSRRSP